MAIYKTEDGTIVTVDPVIFNKRKNVECEGLATEELQVLKSESGFFIGKLLRNPIKRKFEWYYFRRLSDCFWETKEEAEIALIAGDYPIYVPALPTLPGPDNISAYYNWTFSVSIINGKGKKFKNHYVSAIAENYSSARSAVEYDIVGKKGKLLKFNSARVDSRAFATYKVEGSPSVPNDIFKSLPWPTVPDIL